MSYCQLAVHFHLNWQQVCSQVFLNEVDKWDSDHSLASKDNDRSVHSQEIQYSLQLMDTLKGGHL